MKKIVVTGGAGFIGSHTVVELNEAGFEPIIVDNFINSDPSVCNSINTIIGNNIQVLNLDCCDYKLLLERISELGKIDGIIHFAAYKAVGESVAQPIKYYENNLISLLNLLKVCTELQIQHFVFSSSCTVYGQPENIPVDEKAPILPAESPYGNTKQICEEILRDFVKSGKDLKCINLRYFNPIGAHESALIGELPLGAPNNLVPFITQTAVGIRDKLTIFGNDYPTADGTNIRDYIHVVDLAKAHVKALKYLSELPNTSLIDYFNIGSGKGISVLEVVKTFEEVNDLKLNYVFGSRREGDVTAIYAKADKAKILLNWQAEKTLSQALKDAWEWQKTLINGKE